MRKLIFLVSEDWYFVSHRLHLARRAITEGLDVKVCTRQGAQSHLIANTGASVIPFSQQRSGLNPFSVLREAWNLARIYRCEKPSLVHHIALRSVVVGETAAWLAGIRGRVSAITGFGHLFTDETRPSPARRIVERILPWLLLRSQVIVQNQDDAGILRAMGVKPSKITVIAGSGVDTDHFVPMPRPPGPPLVMLSSRMLWDKGVGEFVTAARQLRDSGARFVLVGRVDQGNPSSISEQQLLDWISEGVVEWWGQRSDMARCLNEADIVCLPSYREGLPKSLLEAMACGKPCVATNVTGCRDAVRHEDNGLLVPAKDASKLGAAIKLLLTDTAMRERMGAQGRQRALNEFGLQRISDLTFEVYRRAAGGGAK